MKKSSLLFAFVAYVTFANAEVLNGTCGAEGDGSNLTWSLNTENGTLTISGTGAMAAYTRTQGLEWEGPDSIDNYC